mmetsp:Transcript_39126/g.76337  ORF Transcript_39126/g.76337 Transcript_39126/m.76337 type:complete len:422 (-) Transcript_39126:162-1427(-)
MTLPTISLLFLLAYLPSSQSGEWSPGCESWPYRVPSQHGNWACDRFIQNDPVALEKKIAHRLTFSDSPEIIMNLPEEKTYFCPSESESVLTDDDLPSSEGHEIRWVVHNHASTPVILSWINQQGMEVSAADSKTHPPVADAGHWPDGSMLEPGYVAVVYGYQGQTFLARELLEDASGGGGTKAGRILLKHRSGLIYVRNEKGALCPEDAFHDPEPTGDEAENKISAPFDPDPDCNPLDKGFINKVGCGIDLYFATGGNYTLTPAAFPKGHEPPHCEQFAFHIGVNPRPTDYLDDHSSMVAFTTTYATHRFVARMSHDNSLVAEIVIDHDTIYDCPNPVAKFSSVSIDTFGALDILVNRGLVLDKDAVRDSAGMFRFVNVTEASSWAKNASKMEMMKPDLHIPLESKIQNGNNTHMFTGVFS